MRKAKLVLILGTLSLSALGGCGGEPDQKQDAATPAGAIPQAQIASARQVVTTFGDELKQALLAGLGEGGPTGALSICREMAPDIAARVTQQTGWSVGRTSLRVRNAENAPDDWESQVLAEFSSAQAAGRDPATLEHYEVVTVDGRRILRYMKAIPTGKLCLQCHGTEIARQTAAKLAELYPTDQATGYQEGDIRGAFTLRRPL